MTRRNGRPVQAGIMSGNAAAGQPSRSPAALRRGLPRSPGPAAVAAARLIAVVGLGIDAYVHLDLALMLVSRYVDLGALGPFPDLYDPVWFPEKLWAASGEAAAAAASLAGVLLLSVRTGLRRTRKAPGASGHRGGRFSARG